MSFTTYFTHVKSTCYIHEGKVYLADEPVAIDNSYRNGYIRYDGELQFTPIDLCSGLYLVQTPLVFVGAAPTTTQDTVYDEVMEELATCGFEPKQITFDKILIAESEGIDLEELTKFHEVTLVRVSYDSEATNIFDSSCSVELCIC